MEVNGFLKILDGYQPFEDLKEILKKENNKTIAIDGLAGGAKVHIVSSLINSLEKSVLWIAKNQKEAEKIAQMAEFYSTKTFVLPNHEFIYYEVYAGSEDDKRTTINFFKNFFNETVGLYIVTPVSFMAPIPKKENVLKENFTVKVGDLLSLSDFIKKLNNFERVDTTELQGQFSVRGGICDVFPYTSQFPYRIEFFGDEIDSIRTFDVITKLSIEKKEEAEISNLNEYNLQNKVSLVNKLKKKLTDEENEDLKQIISRDIDRLENNKSLYSYDRYYPLIEDELSYLCEYISNNYIVINDEPSDIFLQLENIYSQHSQYVCELVERNTIIKENISFFKNPVEKVYKLYNNTNILHFGFLKNNFGEKLPTIKINIPTKNILSSSGSVTIFSEEIKEYSDEGYYILIPGRTKEKANRLSFTLSNYDINAPVITNFTARKKGVAIIPYSGFSEGFSYPELKFVYFSDIYIDNKKAKKHKERKNENAITNFSDLTVGDNVVHPVHGIGLYEGITRLKIEKEEKDLIKIRYYGNDILYIPVNQLSTLYKYVGDDSKSVKLNRLGGADFSRVKSRVKASCEDLAEQLIELYKNRELAEGYAFSEDNDMQIQFERTFPYEETQDQLDCIYEVKKDMQSIRPMDRLICGDVGYGKTEIALRAAFKAVSDGKQVAYLAPTTVLAKQHYNTFCERMKDFPVSVGLLSRFCTPKEIKTTIKELKSGLCDIVIGTHRLLSDDVQFKDLGLLVIDEEQRFGVKHKEKIKAMKNGVDVLTLSATPIPRTLNMAMVGIRDVSTLKEPPCNRHPVRTFVLEYNDGIINDAIKKELSRNGQVFYLYNRVESIHSVAKRISENFPEAKVAVAHGKLPREEMERIFYDMALGDIDVLVCTTIIETGLDIPNVNTMIVENSDCFGLSQLYQLRGRVGRSSRLAYCYLTYRQNKSISEVSEKRLRAIKEFTEFGSGFKIAIRDLEIRGAGNILGSQQHGHMDAVGYDMYLKLLDEAVKEKRGEKPQQKVQCLVDLKVSAYIAPEYISDHATKMEIYKKISLIENEDDYNELFEEMTDRFSKIPRETIALLDISYIKSLCEQLGIFDVNEFGAGVTFKLKSITNEFVAHVMNNDRRYKGKILFGAGKNPYFTLKPITLERAKEIKEFLIKLSNSINEEKKEKENGL